MLNLKTGEVIFGGVGTGILSMILMVVLALVAAAANLIVSSATFVVNFRVHSYWNPPGAPVANLGNPGPHGLSEILYANASAVGTNGSAMAGLNAHTPCYKPAGTGNVDRTLSGDCSGVGFGRESGPQTAACR
jgi:K+-transporting ATPase ATPase A chain